MAYLDDDFQGYSIGSHLPFGSWTGSGAEIVADAIGTGIPGTDRSLLVFPGFADYDRGLGAGAFLTSFSLFCAYRRDYDSTFHPIVTCINGPNGSGNSFSLLEIRGEQDGTLSAYCPQTGELLANSLDALLAFYNNNFLQINVTFSDVLVSGVNHLHIDCEVALNGVSVFSCSVTTTQLVSGFVNGTSEANKFRLNFGTYGAFTLDTLQAIVSYPHAGSPKAIVYQAAVEVDELPDDALLQVYQGVVEVDELPDSTKLRVHQAVIEVDVLQIRGTHRAEYIHRRHFPGN